MNAVRGELEAAVIAPRKSPDEEIARLEKFLTTTRTTRRDQRGNVDQGRASDDLMALKPAQSLK